MREILYRAKAINRPPKGTYRTDYENGDWVYGLVSDISEYGAWMTNTDGVSGIDVDKDSMCEFTGLTDKNGNKIFSKDIVRVWLYQNGSWDYRLGLIDWMQESCAFWIYVQNGYNVQLCDSYRDIDTIGNIYDEPELLETQQ